METAFKPRRVLFIVTIFLFWYANYAFVPTFSTYCRDAKASVAVVGVIASAYGLSQLVTRVPLGIFSDFLGRRKIFMLTVGFAPIIVAPALMALFPYPVALFFGRLLSGVSASAWVCATVLYSSYSPGGSAVGAIAVMNITCAVGQVAGNFTGGLAADKIGPTAPFWMSVIAGLAGCVLCLFISEQRTPAPVPTVVGVALTNPEKKRETPDLRGLLSIAKNRLLLTISLLAALANYIFFGLGVTYAPLLARGMQASDTQLGILSMCLPLVGIPGTMVAGLPGVITKKRRKPALVLCVFAMAGLSVLYLLAASVRQLIAVQSAFGFARAFLFTICMSAAIDGVAPEKRGSAMGVFQAVYSFGIFFGPLVTGWISDGFGMSAGFIATAVLVAASGVIAAFVLRRLPDRVQV